MKREWLWWTLIIGLLLGACLLGFSNGGTSPADLISGYVMTSNDALVIAPEFPTISTAINYIFGGFHG